MSYDLVAGVAEGFLAPRRAMRRVFATDPGLDVVLGLVVAAYAIQALAAILIPGARPAPEGASPLLTHLNLLTAQVVLFALTAAAVFAVGRVFGGIGTLPASFVAVAWYSFVTSFLAPAALIGLDAVAEGQPGATDMLLLTGSVAIGLWVFAGCAAELHGFRSTMAVFGGTIGVMFLASAILLLLIPAP